MAPLQSLQEKMVLRSPHDTEVDAEALDGSLRTLLAFRTFKQFRGLVEVPAPPVCATCAKQFWKIARNSYRHGERQPCGLRGGHVMRMISETPRCGSVNAKLLERELNRFRMWFSRLNIVIPYEHVVRDVEVPKHRLGICARCVRNDRHAVIPHHASKAIEPGDWVTGWDASACLLPHS